MSEFILKELPLAMDLPLTGQYLKNTKELSVGQSLSVTQNGGSLDGVSIKGLGTSSLLSIQGWTSNLTFSATDNNTVAWTSGSIILTDGTTFTIDAGNTGNMAAVTYIYFDKAVSLTVLQTTTIVATSVGGNKILIAVAQDVGDATKGATFQVFGGKGGSGQLVTADNIAADAITANELAANSIDGMTITGAVIKNQTGTVVIDDIGLTSTTNFIGSSILSNGGGSTTSTSFVDVAGTTMNSFTLARSAKVFIFWFFYGYGQIQDSTPYDIAIQIYDSDTSTAYVNGYCAGTLGFHIDGRGNVDSRYLFGTMSARSGVGTFAAGTHTLKLQYKANGGGEATWGSANIGYIILGN